MSKKVFFLFLALILISIHGAQTRAESLLITSVNPIGSISASTTVRFSVFPSGFTSPTYAVSDSFVSTGSTVGTITKFGDFSWTPNIYDAGRHTIKITATDNYDHVASTTVDVRVMANNAIVTSITPGASVKVFTPITFLLVTPGFTSPRYTLYQGGRSTATSANFDSTGKFSWTPVYDDIGVHAFTISVSDNEGNSAQTTQNITVIDPSVSVQSLKPGPFVNVGIPVTFTASAMQLASTTYAVRDFFVSTSTITTSMISLQGNFSWKPSVTDIGSHVITVTASDMYGNAVSTTVDILVRASSSIETPLISASTTEPVSATSSVGTSMLTPSLPEATIKKYVFTTYLSVGSRGTAATELQKRLTVLGYYKGPISGYFGVITAAALKQFQTANGISRTGAVGPATRAALNK